MASSVHGLLYYVHVLVDHSLKIPVLNLRYARAGHAKNVNNVKGRYAVPNVWRFLFNYFLVRP